MHNVLRGSAATLLVLALSQPALADGKVAVITSYGTDMTQPIETAFEKAHPGTDLEILNKNTSAGVKYIQEISGNNTADIFWASAPDAFEVLKNVGLLAKVQIDSTGIPDKIGAFPINDSDSMYFGFAASGYGIMWNTRYLEANGLEPATEWEQLTEPQYFGDVGMSAPSRSGTTHLTVETILQGEGWEKGWALLKRMAGNFATVTERSFGVPDGVNTGQFGLGIVIDFFAFSSQAAGYPVGFAYPTVTTVVPANIAVVANAPNQAGGVQFIEWLRSPEGQAVLLNPSIMRLPINPATYAKAPAGFPNPFEDSSIGAAVKFDVDVSGKRYNLVNSLFDSMITFRQDDLKAAVGALHQADAAIAGKDNADARALIDKGWALVEAVPIDEAKGLDPDFTAAFKRKSREKGGEVEQRQAEIEQEWDAFAVKNYTEAGKLAEQALAMLQ